MGMCDGVLHGFTEQLTEQKNGFDGDSWAVHQPIMVGYALVI